MGRTDIGGKNGKIRAGHIMIEREYGCMGNWDWDTRDFGKQERVTGAQRAEGLARMDGHREDWNGSRIA